MVKSHSDGTVPDEELIARWDRGERMATIARSLGMSRERVRQRLERNGRTGPNRNALPPPTRIHEAARAAVAIDDLARALAVTPGALELALDRHRIREDVLLRLEQNRKSRNQEHRLAAQRPYSVRLRLLAQRLGHTPTQDELESEGIFHSRLAQLFGSAQAAMAAAGLVPNQRGLPPATLPADFHDDDQPTSDPETLTARSERLVLTGAITTVPKGNVSPAVVTGPSRAYCRDPAVAAWVRQAAGGVCEACGVQGYLTDTGIPFLEVHHLVPLAEGGPDVVTNAAAVCETCHGKLHRWVNRDQLANELRTRVERRRRTAAEQTNAAAER